MRGQGKRRQAVDVGSLVGSDVEARLGGNLTVRGILVAVDDVYIVIERASTGRRAFVRREAVAVLVDEAAPGLRAASRRRGAAAASEGGGDES